MKTGNGQNGHRDMRLSNANAPTMQELIGHPPERDRRQYGNLEKRELTQRHREICSLIFKGYHNAEIARELGINLQTVKNHNREIFERVGADDRIDLILRFGGRESVLP